MYVTTRTEVRTVVPFFIENDSRRMVSIQRPGHNVGITTSAERIKMVFLANGKVSIKGLGSGGFNAVHVSANSRILMEGDLHSSTLAAFLFVYGTLNCAAKTV